jgi:hypothetical protein
MAVTDEQWEILERCLTRTLPEGFSHDGVKDVHISVFACADLLAETLQGLRDAITTAKTGGQTAGQEGAEQHDDGCAVTLRGKAKAFAATVEATNKEEAVNALREDIVSTSTRTTYGVGVRKYTYLMDKQKTAPWPLTNEKLETFAAFLKAHGARSAGDLHAVVREHQDRFPGDGSKFAIGELETSIKRGLPEEEKAEPWTVNDLLALASVCERPEEKDRVLHEAGAFFTLARSGSFGGVKCSDVVCEGASCTVSVKNLKGEVRRKTLTLHYEAIPDPPKLRFADEGARLLERVRMRIMLRSVAI